MFLAYVFGDVAGGSSVFWVYVFERNASGASSHLFATTTYSSLGTGQTLAHARARDQNPDHPTLSGH